LLLVSKGAAQELRVLRYEGSEVFRFALHQKQLEPAKQAWDVLNSPRSSMIVIVGDTAAASRLIDSAQLRDFIHRGGSILIATDQSNVGWRQQFGINITGNQLTAEGPQNYRGIPGRPFVQPRPAPAEHGGPSAWDIVEGMDGEGPVDAKRIATDRPSEMSILHVRPDLRITELAGYVRGTKRIQGGGIVPNSLFAVSIEPRGRTGRMLVLADHSVFVNGMMGFRKDNNEATGYSFDNGNWEFTNRTIDWLKGGGPEPRTRCLFIEDGNIIDKFAIEIPQPPKPPIPNLPPEVLANILLNSMNPIIEEAQERDFFNRMVESIFGVPRLLRWFFIILTVILIVSGVRWLMRGQRKIEPTATMTPTQQAALLPRGGVLRQRTAAQIEVGNLYEAASRRVRDRFNLLGGRPGADGKMPPVLIAGDVADGPVLRRTVDWLWTLGYGETPTTVAPNEWDQMNALLERVLVRASRGDWSFGQDVS
jgi:hypothetical protein